MFPPLKLNRENNDPDASASTIETMQSDADTEQRVLKKGSYLKRTLPWVVGCSILAYLIWRFDFYALLDALAHADVVLYAAVLIVFIIVNFLADAQNLYAIFSLYHTPIPFRDSVTIRGASYLLMIIDYTLGMGSVVYYLKQYKNISVSLGTGLMIFSFYITHVSLKLMALFGYVFTLDRPSPLLDKIALICVVWLAIDFVIMVFWKNLPNRSFFKKLNFSFVKVFKESSVKVIALNTAYRCVFYFTSTLFFFFAAKTFHMDIPFSAMAAYVPAILLVISIPISAFGLGTSQAAMLFFFKDYGSPAQILAFSLVYSASVIIGRGIVGAYYYSIITRRISNKYKTNKTIE
jgi:hypothetical protein